MMVFTPVMAQPQNCNNSPVKPHHMWEELQLNDDQKTKLKELHQQIRDVRSKHFEAIRGVREKIREELTKQNPSSSQLDEYASQLGNLHKELAIEHNNHMLKVKSVLSAEQFAKIVDRDFKLVNGKFQKNKNGYKGTHSKNYKCQNLAE